MVGLRQCEFTAQGATYVLDLNYPKAKVGGTYRIRYKFVHDPVEGHMRFGYWLFESGNYVQPAGSVKRVWDRLKPAEHERLGFLPDGCTPEGEISSRFTMQRFQRGLMFWFEDQNSIRNIWVLDTPAPDFMSGAHWRRYPDEWPQQEQFSCDEARAHGDRRSCSGFRLAVVQKRRRAQGVGRPSRPEYGSGDQPPYCTGSFFEHGAVFFKPKLQDPLNIADQGLVVFDDGGWRRLNL